LKNFPKFVSGDEHAAFDLVRFDRLEKRLEIAFAETPW